MVKYLPKKKAAHHLFVNKELSGSRYDALYRRRPAEKEG